MSFYRTKKPIVFDYKLDNTCLLTVTSIKDLGVFLDCKLSFQQHINNVVNKSLKLLGFITRITSDFKNINTLRTLYCSLVRPHLEYASVIWSPFYAVHIRHIESVQHRFLRGIAWKLGLVRDNYSYDEIEKTLNLSPLEARRTKFDLICFFKIINHIIDSPTLLQLISFNIPSRRLRNNELLFLNQHSTNYGFYSPLSRMCRLVNSRQDLDFFGISLTKFCMSVNERSN